MDDYLKLLDIVHRNPNPPPWSEGDNIPWNDPGFSQRMLREHLSQEHDTASRREATINQHVAWIHNKILRQRKANILDLGCGPGLYSTRLASLGHTCLGIDYSPASIQYARSKSKEEGLLCTFHEADIRQADFGTGYDLAMLIYGEFNVFKKDDVELILRKTSQSLLPGGIVLLEVHSYDVVKSMGQKSPSWFTSPSGLFSPNPHICLTENFWDEASAITTTRHYVIEVETTKVTRMAQSFQAYHEDHYMHLLTNNGFQQIQLLPSLTGNLDSSFSDFFVITAVRQ